MNSKEIEHFKTALTDIVGRIQQVRHQRIELDARLASLYKEAWSKGLNKKFVKEVLAELHNQPATSDDLWILYARRLGEGLIPDSDDPLDKICDAPSAF